MIATAKEVSKSTAQLVLACQVQLTIDSERDRLQVKAERGSLSMQRLKAVSGAVRKATEELVKAAQGTHEKTPHIRIKKDIFKEVYFDF